ncbi:IQ domain-containing protein K [Marmota marmota marmota]|uniref:IQ domain-containing protein K n=1 Tax=Marmota marmota marmota TaxID=9994 RepID=UPI00209400E7|nr:IQ domain-containing protein K [Marmota marmota marmota]
MKSNKSLKLLPPANWILTIHTGDYLPAQSSTRPLISRNTLTDTPRNNASPAVSVQSAWKIKHVSPLEEPVSHGFNIEHYFLPPPFTRVSHIPCPLKISETVDPKTCSPRKYLETYIFPILLPGMTSLLHQAKKEKCLERKRTKFIACDFLTEWLYNQNPKRTGEPFTEFFSIPFVDEWLKDHPRPPIPLSLLLTDVDAAIAIQSFWRAYLVRCDPEIQELRTWQKKLREDKYIRHRVRIFWMKQERKVKCTMEEYQEPAHQTPAP